MDVKSLVAAEMAATFGGKAVGNSGDFLNSGFCAGDGKYTLLDDSGSYPSIGSIWTIPQSEPWDEYSCEDFQGVYALSAVVYACCRLIAHAFVKPPLELGRQLNTGEWKPVDRPLANLIQRPNPWYSYSEMELVRIIRKHLTGASFTWKLRNVAGEVMELWPLPTCWVDRIVTGGGGIAGYVLFEHTDREMYIEAENMIYSRFPCMDSIYGYMAPLQACLHEIQTDKAREEYLKKMIGNLVRPGMVVTQNAHDGVQRQGLTGGQREDLRESLKSEGTGGTPIFPPGLEVKFPGVLQDLDWSSTEGMLASRICAVFGVEPILIGIRVGLKSGTYSNYGQAKRAFYDETMLPLWKSEQEVWNRDMLARERPYLDGIARQWEFRYNLSELVELQEDANEKTRRGVQALTAGAITVNEFRTRFAGMETAPDGDVYLRLTNILAEPLGSRPDEIGDVDTAMQPEPQAPPESDDADDTGETADIG